LARGSEMIWCQTLFGPIPHTIPVEEKPFVSRASKRSPKPEEYEAMLAEVVAYIESEGLTTSEFIANHFHWELPKTRDVLEKLYSRNLVRRIAMKGSRFKFWEVV